MAAHLERKLGLWSSVSIVVGAVIGSSIFMKPATMAAQLGSPLLLLCVWVLAGVISLFGGMINAEVGCLLPQTGGQFVYFRHMYGDFFAYLFGWACFIVINTASISGISFVFAEYAAYFFHFPRFSTGIERSIYIYLPFVGKFYILENFGVKSVGILLILLFTWINIRSVRAGGVVQVFFSALKVGALLLLVGAIFIAGKGNIHNLVKPSSAMAQDFWGIFTAFMAATTGALAAYDGWNNLGFVGGEIKQPHKNIPRGLILGLGTCILLYVLTSEAYLYMLPVDEMKSSTIVASDALFRVMGPAGAGFVAVLVMISTAGASNGNILPCARITFAMGEERNFFRFAGKVHPGFHTPANALWIQAAWSCLLILVGSFDMLMDMFVFISWIFYGFAAYGIFILRKKMPDAPRPYKMKGYPVLPIIFMAFSITYVVITVYNDIHAYVLGQNPVINSVFGLLLTAAGIPLYAFFKRGYRKS
jgi:basic amino acid/polyamine antiporter, APA family